MSKARSEKEAGAARKRRRDYEETHARLRAAYSSYVEAKTFILAGGTGGCGSLLPTTLDLAQATGLSQHTAQRHMKDLREEFERDRRQRIMDLLWQYQINTLLPKAMKGNARARSKVLRMLGHSKAKERAKASPSP